MAGKGRVASDTEHLFCGRGCSPIGSFKVGFNRVLNEAGVLFGSDGKRRVPYSLRHTYATMRISEGVNIFQPAANVGTSIEMIDDFLRQEADARSKNGYRGYEAIQLLKTDGTGLSGPRLFC